ncbi:DUF3854 domain-containing protein [Gordonia amicalis]|uniref:DUF3854 domain-containing protein n=1 Tax=Gordonia amicalis TaxID=89053 RepID=A0AAE4R427_9ACTN|nr:DUF3854 domain-containing protein [Gordonia amicalis]MDV6312096.1 DUF3854 domain-containing protein [Gordonia amicalis]
MTEKEKIPGAGNTRDLQTTQAVWAKSSDNRSRSDADVPDHPSGVEGGSAVYSFGPAGAAHSSLSKEHAEELAASAVELSTAFEQGVYTAWSADDLPEPVRWIADRQGALPALVYPMREVDGTETVQVKPATPIGDAKYVGPSKNSGHPPQLPVLRDVADSKTVLLVEGVKQALAVLSHGPSDVTVARFTGVTSWMSDGSPTPHLPAVVAGKEVVIIGDADAATNIAVYDGLEQLGEAATAAGARGATFVRIPGKAKQGVDDVLAGLPDTRARGAAILEWISEAKATPADLTKERRDRMRKDKRRRDAEKALAVPDGDRVDVRLVGDWHVDARRVAEAVVAGLGGRVLFQRGTESVEARVGDSGLALQALKLGDLHRQVLSAVRPIAVGKDGTPMIVPGLKRDFLEVLRGHVADRLPRVTRISAAPVVRIDGTIVAESGYDAETGVLVDLSPDVQGLTVPEHPTDEDIAAAVHLLRDELFELDGTDGFDGWVFDTEADRTHAIALLLSCLLRSGFDVVPLALINGVQRGVGKGALIQTIHQVVYGHSATVKSTPAKDEEMEKRITSDLLAGQSVILLDEVMDEDGKCRLGVPSLTAALTASVWGGRKLGASESLSLRQEAVWIATGNNVQLDGDIIRRVFQIRLASDRPDLDERDNFRHHLSQWVSSNRRALLTAALTLVRAWYDRGCPAAPRPFGFVTFEQWQEVVGGILHLAGIGDFLEGVREMRAEDREVEESLAHLRWIQDQVALRSGSGFTAKDVLQWASFDTDAVPPFGHAFPELDSRSLGMVWRRMAGRWYGNYRIVEDGHAHGHVRRWRVETLFPAATPAATAPAMSGVPLETLTVKGSDGRVTEHVRRQPEPEGLSLDDLADAVGGDPDA